MLNERWRLKVEVWSLKDEGMKVWLFLSCFVVLMMDKLTDWWTNICYCRVAFVTEKFAFSDSFARGILLHSSPLTKLENNVLQRCKVVYKESETEKCFNYFCFKQKGISISKRRTWKLTVPDVKKHLTFKHVLKIPFVTSNWLLISILDQI